MPQQKQILIIDDLLTPQENFENSAEKANLNYEIVWDEKAATPHKVEVIVTVLKKLGKEYLQQFPNLKMIAVAFTGYDSVDMEYCKEHGIAIYNVPKYSTNSVVELAIGLTIAVLREITFGNDIIRNKKWSFKPGIELFGKTVGIMGTGEIGVATAKIFKAFGCEVIGWSRSENEAFKTLGAKYIADKQEFFAAADIVSVHLPLNKDTKGIIGKKELAAMKMTAVLVNTARGAIVNEGELIAALEQNKIAGAGLDVFEKEPVDSNNRLLKLDNVVLTPHVAYKTEEALNRRMEVTVKNIADFRDNNKGNRVD
jgi:D-3-phosphoglycerate dehydrogenase